MLFAIGLLAAMAEPSPDPIIGIWRGTSLCQVRPSPCSDERVQYRITAASNGRYHVEMDKMVAGKFEPMGALDLRWVSDARHFIGETFDRQNHVAVWRFKLIGGKLEGNLLTQNAVIYRRMSLTRAVVPLPAR